MSDEHLKFGFTNRAVYAIWLLCLSDDKYFSADWEDRGKRERLKSWLVSHETEIMEQIVEPAVEQTLRWHEEAVGA